jgi:hypothetical protein
MRIVGDNKIYSTLKRLFNINYNMVENLDYNAFVFEIIENNPILFGSDPNNQMFLMDDIEIEELKKSLKNLQLSKIFSGAVELKIDEDFIKYELKKDLLKIFSAYKIETLEKNPNIKRQALFITYTDFPEAWCAFAGEDNYPILDEPQYFEYDYTNELFLPNLTIDFTKIWKKLILLDEAIEQNDLFNQLVDTEKYNALINAYVYKTYIMLYEVLAENKHQLFDGFPIKKPFYVFANQHDCEPINIFIIEE